MTKYLPFESHDLDLEPDDVDGVEHLQQGSRPVGPVIQREGRFVGEHNNDNLNNYIDVNKGEHLESGYLEVQVILPLTLTGHKEGGRVVEWYRP